MNKLLAFATKYATDFGSALVRPQAFLAQKNSAAAETFAQAMLFLAISTALWIVLTALIFRPVDDLWALLGVLVLAAPLAVSLYAVAPLLAWRIVGGRASVRSMLVTYAYHFGVFVVAAFGMHYVSICILAIFSPEFQFMRATGMPAGKPVHEWQNLPAVLLAFAIGFGGEVGMILWALNAWSAYRILNGLTKVRSLLALLIAIIVAIAIWAALSLLWSATNTG